MPRSHDPAPSERLDAIGYDTRPVQTPAGTPIQGLHVVWISLRNEGQLNSYTTEALRQLGVAVRRASMDRSAVAVVLTGEGNRAFCAGGNTEEYAEVYAGHPDEYRQYMRLFNDAVTSILQCDRPVINRVNGMRIAGGQELGMACDFTIASDMARFGQAGPKHGSAPDGGATDFLPLYVGIENAMLSCTVCEPWTAHKALRLGLVTDIAPVLRVDGRFIPNPLACTDRVVDEWGRPCLGELKTGEAAKEARKLMTRGEIDFSMLDEAVASLCSKLAMTMPGCLSKTLESLRKHKLFHWQRNAETNRAWLALNMMTEAKAGFRAFQSRIPPREVDFVELRRRLAEGEPWSDALIDAVQPKPVAAGSEGSARGAVRLVPPPGANGAG